MKKIILSICILILLIVGIVFYTHRQQQKNFASKIDPSIVPTCFFFSRNLKLGDTGKDVFTLNYILKVTGFSNVAKYDETYTNNTGIAVGNFQNKFRIKDKVGIFATSTRLLLGKLSNLEGCRI